MSNKYSLPFNNEELCEEVYDNNEFIFLSGPAGCGKSYTVNKIATTIGQEKVQVTASTGVAAALVDGITVHSTFKLGIRNDVRELIEWDEAEVRSSHIPIKKKLNGLRERMNEVDLIIIDEISMISAETFEMIIYRMKQINLRGKKIIMVGDLLQLPPVKGSMISSHMLFKYSPMCYLDKNYRTTNEKFIGKLNEARVGQIDLEYWKQFSIFNKSDYNPDDMVNLVSTNKVKDSMNKYYLDKIDSPAFHLQTFVKPDEYSNSYFTIDEHREAKTYARQSNIPESITMKVGAKVLITMNMGVLVNGDYGEVTNIHEDIDGNFMEDYVTVFVPRLNKSYKIKRVEKSKTRIDNKGDIVSDLSLTYLPLTHAWAITIHKSQGMTIDRLFLDATGLFSESQFYVGVSRCSNPDNLYIDYGASYDGILPNIKQKMANVNNEALRYYHEQLEVHENVIGVHEIHDFKLKD